MSSNASDFLAEIIGVAGCADLEMAPVNPENRASPMQCLVISIMQIITDDLMGVYAYTTNAGALKPGIQTIKAILTTFWSCSSG